MTFREVCCCWAQLCYGRACCFYNVLFSPFVLVWHAFDIYCWQCLNLYLRRCFFAVCCFPCKKCGCFEFEDIEFPPNGESLGNVGGDTATGKTFQGGAYEWVRAGELSPPSDDSMQLFSDVNSRDIMQGQLGDCWLMAAMAAIADQPGAIYSLFLTKERDPRGKYKIRIYDGVAEAWETIVIDDYVPCRKAGNNQYEPLFARPNGHEMWVLLLEKAFAKFCGSYHGIEAGNSVWAMKAMTGDNARQFRRIGDTWEVFDLVNVEDPNNRRKFNLKPRPDKLSQDDTFEVLKKYCKGGSILCVSGASGQLGLITRHAYSIISMKWAKGFKLVKIRNPHSHGGEWQGDWSDKSALWQKHKDVAEALGFENKGDADGEFWMAWSDFIQHWDNVDVVDRTIDIKTLRIQVADDECISPTTACCRGCFSYWCLCRGIRRLYCARRTSDVLLEADNTCCFGLCNKRRQTKQEARTRGIRVPVEEPSDSDEETQHDSDWLPPELTEEESSSAEGSAEDLP